MKHEDVVTLVIVGLGTFVIGFAVLRLVLG